MITITFKTVTNINFAHESGFFVQAGDVFDAGDYCEAYGLNRSDLDEQSVKAAQNASAGLNTGEWLHVDHEA